MRIIIAGAGEVGFHLARLLARESQDIVLIDLDRRRLDYAASHLDIFPLHGDSTSIACLREARVARADLLIAVTSRQDTNINTAAIGKRLGAKQTIARVRNMEYLTDTDSFDLRSMGIDELISPEALAAREIRRLIRKSAAKETFEFERGKLSLIGMTLEEGAPVVGQKLKDLAPARQDWDYITVAIHRNGETIIPRGDTAFHAGDSVYFITKPGGFQPLMTYAGKQQKEIKKVMILGASQTGVHTARALSKAYSVKLVERDRQRCEKAAEELPHVLVIQGDGTNVELLTEEGIDRTDAFIAVTGNSETNILSSLLASRRGVMRTIAMVENTDYIQISQNIGLDTLINKKLIAANFIFRYVRQGEVVSMAGIQGIDAEILEFKVKADSKITRKPIRELGFPHDAVIGGVVRENKGYITLGDFQIEANDRVVVFALASAIRKVEQFFK